MKMSRLINTSTSGLSPTGGRQMRLILKRIDDNVPRSPPPIEKEDKKRKREDDEILEETKIFEKSEIVENEGQEIGFASRREESLANLQKRLCPHKLEVTLERLRFKEILVTVPKEGERQVHYFSLASDSEDDDDSEEEDDEPANRRVGRGRLKYEDWRLQTIKSFPSSSSGKPKNNETENTPDSFFMEIPSCYDFVFNVGRVKDDLQPVLEVLDGGKMSTTIIDGYMLLRLEKYYRDFYDQQNRQLAKQAKRENISKNYSFRTSSQSNPVQNDVVNKRPTNFQYLSVNFMPVKDREQPVSTFIPNKKYLPNLCKLGNDSDVQLIAPLYASHHLYLAVFNFQEKRVYVYDSSWHYLPQPLREGQIQAVLQAISPPPEIQTQNGDDSLSSPNWQINFVETSCPQYDEYSCGIFTIHYAENVLSGVAHHKNRWQLSKRRVMQIRRHIAKELLSTTRIGRRFLQAISD